MKRQLKNKVYVKFGNGVLSLPEDLPMLAVALGELMSVGYKGDVYSDEKLTKSLGDIKSFFKRITALMGDDNE